jgi:hypothetical protein
MARTRRDTISVKEFQDSLVEVSSTLEMIDRLIPKRVDKELIDFIKKAETDEWTAELMLNAIQMAGQIDQKSGMRRTA